LFSEQPSLARYPPYPLALPETSRIILLGRQKGILRVPQNKNPHRREGEKPSACEEAIDNVIFEED
jgi:hypothetical protein